MTPPRGQPPGSRWPTSLTSRGWGLVAVTIVMVVAARLFGIVELYPVAAAAAVLVIYGVAWTWTRRWRIDVGRRLQPARIEAGGGALVIVTLHNRSDNSSPVLTLRDPFDGGHTTTTLLVAPMASRQRVSGSYRLPAAGRGVFTLGPLTLEAVDPLGLARRARSSAIVSSYVIHPRVDRLRPPRVAAGPDRNRGTALPVAGHGNDEFSSLREYQQGDDIRRMHWVSTARTDTLMVRENQLERRGQFGVVLDTRATSWSAAAFERAVAAAAFERAVSASASIVGAALDAGLHARLLTTDGLDSGTGAGRAHRSHLLDLLARVQIHTDPAGGGADDRSTGGLHLPAGGTVAVVTSDTADIDRLRRQAGVGIQTDLILVLIDRSTVSAAAMSGRRVPGGAGRVIHVGPATPLAAVWDPIA